MFRSKSSVPAKQIEPLTVSAPNEPDILKLLGESNNTMAKAMAMPSHFLADRPGEMTVSVKAAAMREAVLREAASRQDTWPLPELREGGAFQGGPITPFAKLAMRMGWLDKSREGWLINGIKVKVSAIAKIEGGYAVFAVVNGKPMTFEDAEGLFPSDGLVTKLKMLEE